MTEFTPNRSVVYEKDRQNVLKELSHIADREQFGKAMRKFEDTFRIRYRDRTARNVQAIQHPHHISEHKGLISDLRRSTYFLMNLPDQQIPQAQPQIDKYQFNQLSTNLNRYSQPTALSYKSPQDIHRMPTFPPVLSSSLSQSNPNPESIKDDLIQSKELRKLKEEFLSHLLQESPPVSSSLINPLNSLSRDYLDKPESDYRMFNSRYRGT